MRTGIAGLSHTAILAGLLALSSASSSSTAYDQPLGADWKEAKPSGDLLIYYRDDQNLQAREVFATTEREGSPAAYFKALKAPGVVPYVRETRALKHVSKKEEVDYIRIHAPVVNERDTVVRVDREVGTHANRGVYRMTWESMPGYLPPQKGVVRMEVNKGSWTFTPLDRGRRTRITYRIIANPAGMIPHFLAASSAITTVPPLFNALESWVAQNSLQFRS